MGIGGEIVARITAVVGVDSKELKAGLAEAEAATKEHSGRMGKTLAAAGKISAVGFAVLGAAAFEGVKGAIALQQKMAGLDKVLKNAHVSASDMADADNYLEEQSNKTGFAIGDLTDGFGKAVTALGSYKKAQQETTLAENIARATGESLAMANKQAIKVYEGKNTALAKLGVQLPKITTAEDKLRATNKHATAAEKAHAKEIDKKLTALADAKVATEKYGGSTEAYSKTLGGELQITENRFKNLLDTLGAKLLPVITRLFGFLAGHTNILIGVGAALGAIWVAATAVTVVTKAYAAATKIAAAVQWLWNAAMSANPIGLVVVAIAALVAGVILAYKHFATFRKAVHELWGKLQEVWSWIKGNWPLLLAVLTGPFGVAVLVIRRHWQTIKDDVNTVVGWFRGLPDRLANALAGLPSAIAGGAHKVSNAAINLGKSILRGIISGLWGIGDWVLNKIESALGLGSNVNLNAMAGQGGYGGRGSGGHAKTTTGPQVNIHQTILTNTDNQGVHMQRARFAAAAAFGG